KVVVDVKQGRPVALAQVATIREGPQIKRGDSSAFVRIDGELVGGSAVILTVNKQPGADTRRVTREILEAIERDLRPSLAEGIRIEPIYSQTSFITRAIDNVLEALRD